MKKLLLTTTVLVATAGAAAAEITFSGSGRFGLQYLDDNVAATNNTRLDLRFRTEINGSVETDSGVKFGGRVRLQYNEGSTGATLSAAYVEASYQGLLLRVGNVSSAEDSTKLIYNSELGYSGFGAGDPIGGFTGFSSGPYSAAQTQRVGVLVAYGVGDLNVRLSYQMLDQTLVTLPAANDNETSISADYVFGAVTVSAAYTANAGFDKDRNAYAIAAEYAFNDAGNIGLLYFNVDDTGTAVDASQATLYGNYAFDALTVRAFVASLSDTIITNQNVAYGLGVDYDLGGATLAAGIQRDFANQTYAEVGVKFSF